MPDDTLIQVVCHEPNCPWKDQVRTVRMAFLGNGIYARTPLVCQCSPDREVRYASPADETRELVDLFHLEPPC